MSGQWEVVGKGKKDKNNKKLSKSEKKKIIDNAPKVEDLLPLSQVKTLYSALESNKDASKPAEKANKPKENDAKKSQQKKQPEKKKEKAPPQSNKPAVTENAANGLSIDDVKVIIEVGGARFENNPLVWLKDLPVFLNKKLSANQQKETGFLTKSFDHPLCLLPIEIRNLIKKRFKDIPSDVLQSFFDYCLSALAEDLSKGYSVVGYKMILQLLATQYPFLVTANFDDSIALRNSYQNNQQVCFAIMWALGQGGYKDLSAGLKVWQNIILPLSGNNMYTKYVFSYLNVLLSRHSTSKSLGSGQYFSVLDSIFSDVKFPHPATKLKCDLEDYHKPLTEIACNQPQKLHMYFSPLIERIQSGSQSKFRDICARFAVACLKTDQQSFDAWKSLYPNNLWQSAHVLKVINSDLETVKSKVSTDILIKTISSFKSVNDNMVKKNQKAAGLQDCVRLCDTLLNKMAVKKSFSIFRVFLFIFIALGITIYVNLNKNGSLKDTPLGNYLKAIHLYDFVESSIKTTRQYYGRAYKWSQNNLPGYYAVVADASQPYVKLLVEYGTIAYTHVKNSISVIVAYILEKLPLVAQWIDSYAPGLNSKELFFTVYNNASYFAEKAVKYTLNYSYEFFTFIVNGIHFLISWLQENVFVGNLSSENLQKYASLGINATCKFATQTYVWVQDKFISLYSP